MVLSSISKGYQILSTRCCILQEHCLLLYPSTICWRWCCWQQPQSPPSAAVVSFVTVHGDRTQSGDICCGWQTIFYCQGLQTSSSCQKHWHAWFPLFFSLNSPSESLLHFAWMYRKMTFNASEHSKKAASCTGFIVVPVTGFSRYSRTLSLLCNEELFSYENRFSFYQKKDRVYFWHIDRSNRNWKELRAGRKFGRYAGFEVLVWTRIESGSQICKDFWDSSKIDRDSDIFAIWSHF